MRQLRYDRPAREWNEALPIGNGRMGAMVFGQPVNERIQLNEDSIWYGGPLNRINPDAGKQRERIRGLILEERISEAEELMLSSLSGTPQSQRPYQTAGDMELKFSGVTPHTEEYSRVLDLEAGMTRVSFRQNGQEITKEYLASFPDQVIAIHITASVPGTLVFSLLMTRSRFYNHGGKLSEDSVFLDGVLGDGGISYILAAKASVKGGRVYTLGERLIVEAADEATIYLAMETSFYHQETYRSAAFDRLEAAVLKGYEAIKKDHMEDYQKLYGRVSLRLGLSEETKEDLASAADLLASAGDEGERELWLAETYFQYGRYLLISSSRPGSMPANLQGIWNKDFLPSWDSKYTININTEMNYWPAEICNLPECHLPLFDLIKRMHPNGKKVAEEMYGCRGFMAHNNTDLWADCAPQGNYIPGSYWVTGAAWLCTHIWTHYLYTGDKEFLKEMYPALKDSVLFFHDFLMEDKEEMVTCFTVSPENTYILPNGTKGCVCLGPSMDNQILRHLFDDFIKASKELEIEDGSVEETRRLITKLPPNRIGKHGQLMEWREDYGEAEPGHRHIAHLYALHPAYEITPDKTPELAKAAEKTLERRLQHTKGCIGWTSAWITSFYSRLWDGEKALDNLRKLWGECTLPNFMDCLPHTRGELFFQIDGNFGGTAAMADMLLQSNEGRTILLPALPAAWKDGHVRGIKTAGGAEVDMEWKNGALCGCRLTAMRNMEIRLVYGGEEHLMRLEKEKTVDFMAVCGGNQ